MPSAVDTILDQADQIIQRFSLHGGDPIAPVPVDCLLESATVNRWWLPEGCMAISVQWDGEAGMTLNWDLYEPGRSQELRHTKAHEGGHILRRHRGYYVLWRRDVSREDRFAQYIASRQERECEILAAYILVRREALRALRDQDIGYIATLLDVPTHLVELRSEIVKKYKR